MADDTTPAKDVKDGKKDGTTNRQDPATSQLLDAPATKPENTQVFGTTDAEKEDAKRVATDPWGNTPLQMRDQHSPEVDPAKADD